MITPTEIESGLWLYSTKQAGLESYCHGIAECLQCHAQWVAVWPLGADALECPKCGSIDTDRTAGECK